MAGLRSFGRLADARKALRRLFRRPQPAEDEVTATTTTTTTTTTTPIASENSLSTTTETTAANESPADTRDHHQAAEGRLSQKETEAVLSLSQFDCDVYTMTVAAFPHDQSKLEGIRQHRTMQFDNKENQLPTNSSPRKVASLLSPLGKLSIVDRGDRVKEEENVQESQPEIEEDPAVLAERAKHLRFIGEALEMVSHAANPSPFVQVSFMI